jgi:hypothetical protein
VFALSARIFLKTGAHAEFTRIVEKEVVPLLRKQAGFADAVTLLVDGCDESIHLTFWNSKEHADNYARDLYPRVLSTLWRVLDANPAVQTYEVASSTMHSASVLTASV